MAEAEAWVMIPKLDKDKTGCVLEMHPLVLCKNCKWFSEKGICKHPDGGAGNVRPADWFCADGKAMKQE